MKKTLTIAVALLLMAAGAFATNTRVLTLGENNNVLIDDANIWMYPSRINQYPNLGIGEFTNSSNDFYNFGIHWKFGESNPWVLATYFSTQPPVFPTDYFGNSLSSLNYYPDATGAAQAGPGRVPTNRRVNLLWGKAFGNMKFGIGLDLISHSVKHEETDNNPEQKFSQYMVTLGLTPQEGNWDAAASVSFGSWTDKAGDGTDISKSDGYNDIMLQGRYFHKVNPTITLVPHAAIAFGKHGEKLGYTFGDGPYKSTLTGFELGGGMNYTPVTNVLAVADFGFQYSKIKQEDSTFKYTETTTTIPYWKIGLEGDIFSWLDVRFGAVSDWHHIKGEDVFGTPATTVTDKIGAAYNETFLGLGFNFNRLHIDTYMDPEIVLDGFNFISGSNDAQDLNFNVSVLYEMF